MSGAKEIPVQELNVSQLNQLSQQLEQELEMLQSSLSSLKVAQAKFGECKESLGKIGTSAESSDILVPLTSSMYVSGQLSESDAVLVDVGTGYFIDMKIDAAKEYYQRKVDFLTQQMEKLQSVLREKFDMKEVVVEILQSKVQQQLSTQQQLASVAPKS